MFGLSNTDLDYLARMQIDQRTKEAKARRLARVVRGRRDNHSRRPVRLATH